MTAPSSISAGWHFGTASQSARFGRFLLTETRYRPGLTTPWHGHETAAFCLVLAGRYRQRFRRHEVVYRPATAVFRPSEVEHTDRIAPQGATCFIIEPDSGWLAESGLGALDRGSALEEAGPRTRWLLEHARAELRHPDATTALALEGLVLAAAAEFARIPAVPSEPRCAAWLARTREALDAGFRTRTTLAELAAAAGVHPVHLAASFRAAFGVSVGNYVRARRIDAARAALRDERRSINEIALTLGFSSQSHFTREFRRRTGLTPLSYRRSRPAP